MSDKPFEIPETMRDMAEQSVSQARSAYDQFMDATRKAQEMVEQSSGAMLAAAREIHATALKFAEENMKAGFELAERLVNASDFQEALKLQNEYARKQMETYSRQAQKLTSMMADAARKSQQP